MRSARLLGSHTSLKSRATDGLILSEILSAALTTYNWSHSAGADTLSGGITGETREGGENTGRESHRVLLIVINLLY